MSSSTPSYILYIWGQGQVWIINPSTGLCMLKEMSFTWLITMIYDIEYESDREKLTIKKLKVINPWLNAIR